MKLALGILCTALMLPKATKNLRFLQVSVPLTISSNKLSPALIALKEIETVQKQAYDQPNEPLGANKLTTLDTQIIRLQPLVIALQPLESSEADETLLSLQKIAGTVPQDLRQRLERVQSKKTFIETVAALQEEAPPSGAQTNETTEIKTFLNTQLMISGAIEVLGVGFGPQRKIEIFRNNEGQKEERGAVDIRNGTYSIKINDLKGKIVAQVKDDSGKVHGQASFYLSQIRATNPLANVSRTQGPKITIEPTHDHSGAISSHYPNLPTGATTVAANSGFNKANVNKQNEFDIEQEKGSQTIIFAKAKNHMPTAYLAQIGKPLQVEVFPESWARSLRQIVSEQRQANYDNPEGSIVWGKVVFDGKPQAGVSVDATTEPGQEVVYFNEWMLPDQTLKVTSTSGVFAILNMSEGYHSLKATLADGYFAHDNIVVQQGTVTKTVLKATMRTEISPIRVFDAFTGESRAARITHQTTDIPVDVSADEEAQMSFPVLPRTSLAYVQAESPYLNATYLHNEAEGFLHLPLIREDWLRALQSGSKISDTVGTSIVVGFVPEADFSAEVFEEKSETTKIIYFNARGEPAKKGVPGGGFIIFGLATGAKEIGVYKSGTDIVSSKVLPSEDGGFFVLKF
jgi:hypothetical protein